MPNASRRRLADTADRHVLYQRAVQSVDAEIDFVDDTFKALRGRRAVRLREDFCGTGNTSCEWVRRRPTNVAVGLDLDRPTLDWGVAHNVPKLPPRARPRVHLLEMNVLDAGAVVAPGHAAHATPAAEPVDTGRMDCVLAMNFSWWILKERATLLRYFRSVHRTLVADGVFFLDIYGGWEAMKEQTDRRPILGGHTSRAGYTYLWEQETFDPITNEATCHISFKLRDGSTLRRAFSYTWRLYTIPEARDILLEAGFKTVTVHWEGDDGKGSGNGVFAPAEHGECCAAFIAYLVAEK